MKRIPFLLSAVFAACLLSTALADESVVGVVKAVDAKAGTVTVTVRVARVLRQ